MVGGMVGVGASYRLSNSIEIGVEIMSGILGVAKGVNFRYPDAQIMREPLSNPVLSLEAMVEFSEILNVYNWAAHDSLLDSGVSLLDIMIQGMEGMPFDQISIHNLNNIAVNFAYILDLAVENSIASLSSGNGSSPPYDLEHLLQIQDLNIGSDESHYTLWQLYTYGLLSTLNKYILEQNQSWESLSAEGIMADFYPEHYQAIVSLMTQSINEATISLSHILNNSNIIPNDTYFSTINC